MLLKEGVYMENEGGNQDGEECAGGGLREESRRSINIRRQTLVFCQDSS